MKSSDLAVKEIQLTLEKDGRTKEEALSRVFHDLRQEIYGMVPGSLIYMEPLEVKIENISVETWTERFLWVFMPRERRRYILKVRLTVLVKYVDLALAEGLNTNRTKGVRVG
ncbi:MAG: DUF4312 family protein [Firmicutes bacterium]|nr:DUF4312 family protein [Bacillota bacterium]